MRNLIVDRGPSGGNMKSYRLERYLILFCHLRALLSKRSSEKCFGWNAADKLPLKSDHTHSELTWSYGLVLMKETETNSWRCWKSRACPSMTTLRRCYRCHPFSSIGRILDKFRSHLNFWIKNVEQLVECWFSLSLEPIAMCYEFEIQIDDWFPTIHKT